MEDLKIGVIGSAGRGIIATHAHKPGAGSRVVACCDIDPATLERNKERYGADLWVTQRYDELLQQDLDAVFITTPDFLHEEMAIAALRAGKATYLEKPLAISTEACDRVLRAALESKTRLYLGHNMRHMPFVRKMKELIDAGAIGEVKTAWCRHFVGNGGDYYFKDWHAERQYSTGLLLQKGAHDIDVLHWLCGGFTQRVNAFGSLMVYGDVKDRAPARGMPTKPDFDRHEGFHWPPATQTRLNAEIDIEDVSMMQMQLDNGVLASYQQCHFTPDYWRSYTVIGSEGRLENFGNGEDGTCIKVWNQRKWGYNAPDEVHMIGNTTGEHGGADPLIVAEFVRFAREGGPTQTSPLAARHSVAAGCAATYSLRNGGQAIDVTPIAADIAAYFV
jgi:predicted dehydrogenase